MAKSRNKGQRGEREVSKILTAAGVPARRGGQQGAGGSAEAPDVLTNLPWCHFEIKRVEAYGVVNRAMTQAIKDAGDRLPLMLARANFNEWLLTLQLKEILNPRPEFVNWLCGRTTF